MVNVTVTATVAMVLVGTPWRDAVHLLQTALALGVWLSRRSMGAGIGFRFTTYKWV